MTILEMKVGTTDVVSGIGGGKKLVERLQSYGFYVGREVKLVKAAPFRGPLLVEDMGSGARIMIARTLADKIEVRNGRSPAH
jgi:Fe2+ transport system protein FeoA